MFHTKNVKFVVYVPESHAKEIRKVIGEFGAGHVRNYDFCSFSTKGVGRFRPLEGAHPTVGEKGRIEEVDEERVEVLCPRSMIEDLVMKVIKAHPYEDVAYDVYPVEDF